MINHGHADRFNVWIDKWGLMDIKDPSRSFTWSNNQRCPILTVLDRTLISVELGIKYPTTKMVKLPKEASGQNPLLLDLGGQIQIKDPMFRFEKWWLEIDGFEEIVKEVWQAECPCSNPVDRWQYKIRLLRKKARDVVFESYFEGALGPDGFSFLLYQKFWPLIKEDLMKLIHGFSRGEVNIARLHYAMITLIPKEEEARNLKKFRSISLINCSFKIFAKALNNILVAICDRLLSYNQTAFVKCRFILESVVASHEIIHDAVRGAKKEVVLKLDYEKAYDRVSWHFLEEMLISRGFGKNRLPGS
jgi:hypothetical protein